MKQHIAIEQLKQLKADDVCKLNTLMNHEWDISKEEYEKYTWNKILQDTAEYCTIGRMIELLESKDDCINITKLLTDIDHKELWGWETALRHLRKSSCDIELCDALWQIVKEVL